MKIQFRTLGKLERGYSIALLPAFAGERYQSFLVGSEDDHELLMFAPPDFTPRVIGGKPGGYISIWPLESKGRRYVATTNEFKPGFNGADTSIRLYPLDAGELPPSTLIAERPYTHRLALHRHGGHDYFFASTLCAAKSHKEDWTQPGGIFLARVPDDPTQRWPLRQIVHGLNKNHGFEFALLGREPRPGWLLSALEGLFFMPNPENFEGVWTTERISSEETSDAFAFDWDGDGEPEIFSISPFHGNVLALHKRGAAGWSKTVIHDDLALGHVVWAGQFLGRPGLLAGSRRERRELRLYRPKADGTVDPNYELIDSGIGPSQLAVVTHGSGSATLYVAAHGVNEVRIYDIEA